MRYSIKTLALGLNTWTNGVSESLNIAMQSNFQVLVIGPQHPRIVAFLKSLEFSFQVRDAIGHQELRLLLHDNPWDLLILEYPFSGMTVSDIVSLRDRFTPQTSIIFALDKALAKSVPSSVLASGDDYFIIDDVDRLLPAVHRAIANRVIRQKHWEAESKAHQQAELNQVILDSLPHPIMLIKPNTFEIVAANRAASESGVARGGHCYKTWAGEDTPCAWCLAPVLWKSGMAQQREVFWKGRWWEAHWIPADKDHYLHFVYDITALKKAEEGMQLRVQLLDSVSDSVFLSEVGGTILDCNENAFKTRGYAREELIGADIRVLRPVVDVPDWDETRKQIIEKGEITYQSSHRRKDGSTFPIEVHARSIERNGSVQILSVVRDIAERKQAEDRLKTSINRLSAAERVSRFGNWEFNLNDNLVFASQGARRIYGLLKETLTIPEVQQIPLPEYRSMLDKALADLVTRNSPYEVEFKIKRPSDALVLDIHSIAEFDRSRNVVFGVIQDVTEARRAEEENRKLREKAENASRLSTVGEMAAGIAHEINNPLTGVVGFSELLLGRTDLPADVIDQLQIINQGSVRVKEIVGRMLTFARQNKPRKSSVNIAELLDNTLELRSYVLRTSNIEVVRDYDYDLPSVIADAGQLQQVFLNIIVNAEYSMKKAHDKGILRIGAAPYGDCVRISIQDNGLGMNEDVVSKLFQPFFTTKDPGEGTGLGLSLSLGIIQEHGGDIRVESVLGDGATFIIELPITAGAEIPPATQPVTSRECKTASAKVLVIDDEPHVRSLIKTLLTRSGHLVETCDNPLRATDILKSRNFDVVFLDIRMPGKSGIEIYNEMRETSPEQAKRVVFVTGDSSDFMIREFLKTRGVPCIMKPLDRKAVETAMDDVRGGVLRA
ncbi:PAS domain S-box-containing protein [Dehalogenimonas formicexedens]|uniref:histidine kinase n=1 Tax=Dehalogenimonas formicexedens TaxID=1839801 RepID=A0A1P8F7X5_9CHLR|nr:PAS domain S-box protein [Dehalogenimonas formicexedens]APV44492.1 PAS domain S-box-containing protein [Dehalogenimonas formicexedens]